jgi:hypothetical protein
MITDEMKEKYVGIFARVEEGGLLKGKDKRTQAFFMRSGLTRKELQHIWGMSDLDKDGQVRRRSRDRERERGGGGRDGEKRWKGRERERERERERWVACVLAAVCVALCQYYVLPLTQLLFPPPSSPSPHSSASQSSVFASTSLSTVGS